MAAHVYWRILITATSGTVATITELGMYDASGTSLATGGTASASSYYAPEGDSPDKAFDGLYTTWWASNVTPSSGSPEWLRYQFASAVDVALFRMTRRGDGLANQSPIAFKLQYSDDGSSWTDAGTYSIGSWGAMFTISFPVSTPAAGLYANWRIYVQTVSASTQAAIAEIVMREVAAGANITSNVDFHSSASDAFDGTTTGPKAYDRSTATIWAASTVPPNWVANSMNRVLAVAEISLTARNDTFYTQSPGTFKLQGSNDGVTWTDAGSFTAAAWTTGSTQTFTVSGAAGALLRHPGMEGWRPLMHGGISG